MGNIWEEFKIDDFSIENSCIKIKREAKKANLDRKNGIT